MSLEGDLKALLIRELDDLDMTRHYLLQNWSFWAVLSLYEGSATSIKAAA